ncbi:hypothetical protein EC988_000005 [Linderina pennispora]|nr:hypothetical protein EC988_000005 [Linderina pennispora]
MTVEVQYSVINPRLLSFDREASVGDGFLVPIRYKGGDLLVATPLRGYYKIGPSSYNKEKLLVMTKEDDVFNNVYTTVREFIMSNIRDGYFNNVLGALSKNIDEIGKINPVDKEKPGVYARVDPATTTFFSTDGKESYKYEDISSSGECYGCLHIKSIYISAGTATLQIYLRQLALPVAKDASMIIDIKQAK